MRLHSQRRALVSICCRFRSRDAVYRPILAFASRGSPGDRYKSFTPRLDFKNRRKRRISATAGYSYTISRSNYRIWVGPRFALLTGYVSPGSI
ncbi:hypothetical protein HSR121_2711 [Halapricum desulfuricans]|uniref:Uncharacterized protein n=1 Tax=Halapricum desulfuricans TaxID=2841257 RepID=A0A897N3G2_9EURY|nr:hypothetical protein HSR121_2711 [Halapricum desulfuricans]